MARFAPSQFKIDPFILLLLGTVALASFLPARGAAAPYAAMVTQAAIALLFFLHGAKLSRQAIWAGVGAWRVHAVVFASSFVLFPLIGLGVRAAGHGWLDPAIASGILFLTLLPSTVQSSIAFTSIAGGNVPAAVCSASFSNLIGIVLTPLLVALLLGGSGNGISTDAVGKIALQLLLPFIAGHLARPLIGATIDRHKALVGRVDRTSILLVVYTAFSASVIEGLWHRLGVGDLIVILLLDAMVLAIVLLATTAASRTLGFSRADEIVIVFCGSKKSLASGVPMAGALFPAAALGPVILPLMLFHQLQLMVCAVLAARYARGGAVTTARAVLPITADRSTAR